MLDIIIGILAFVFALGIIICTHEGGHFLFARKFDVLCREFAFGMGPQIVKTKKGETEYSIRAFPIGGFCAIAGEELEDDPLKLVKKVRLLVTKNIVRKIYFDEGELYSNIKEYEVLRYDLYDDAELGHLFMVVNDEGTKKEFKVDPRAMFVFTKPIPIGAKGNKEKLISKRTKEIQIAPYNRTINSKTKTQRALIMFGGPLMNFVLALLMFFIAALIIGFSEDSKSVVDDIDKDSYVYQTYGLREGDQITSLSVNLTADSTGVYKGNINYWSQVVEFMELYRSDDQLTGPINVTFVRNGKERTTIITPRVIIYSVSMYQDITKEGVVIGPLDEKSKAAQAGLKAGDEIVSIDNEEITNWKQVYYKFVENEKGNEMEITLKDGRSVKLKPYSKELFEKTQDVPVATIQLGLSPQLQFNLPRSIVYSFTETGASVKKMFNTLALLFSSSEVGIGDLSGPIGIFSLTSSAASNGIGSLLNLIGFLSVNIGLLNLLPIPALDGGRLVFVGYEAITKKKPSPKIETILITVTMVLLLGLMVFVAFNDILRLI